MNALSSGQDCFFAEEPWQSVIVHNTGTPTRTVPDTVTNSDNVEIGDHYFLLMVSLPCILRQGYALSEANVRGEPIDIPRALALAESAQQLHAKFLDWYPRLLTIAPAPKEIASEDPASNFPLVFQYDSPWMGSLYMGYWASMLILQETLIQCRYPSDYAKTNKEFALNILRSVESVDQGVMGAYRCGYGVKIAFEFADEKQKAWLRYGWEGWKRSMLQQV